MNALDKLLQGQSSFGNYAVEATDNDWPSETDTFLLNFRFLQKFPRGADGKGIRLKKSRARMMLDAMSNGYAWRGNVGISFENESFTYSFRGTNILIWDAALDLGGINIINTEVYEELPSTIYQRKQAYKAIEEFRRGVLFL